MLNGGRPTGTTLGHKAAVGYRLMRPLLLYNYLPHRHKRVIALSESIKEELVNLCNTPEERIVVIPNGVDPEEFHPDNRRRFRDAIRQRHALQSDDFVFLFVGNAFRRKGLPLLLEAFAKVQEPTARLLVVGRDDANLPWCLDLADRLGIRGRTVFVGPSEVVNQYYGACDAFVFPTLYEACALVPLEAMASGVPVLTTRLAGARDVLTDGCDALLFDDPTDSHLVAEHMRRILRDTSLHEQLAVSGRTTAERYSWDAVAERTLALYHEIASAKAPHISPASTGAF
ncbi:MAG: hypothetical protein AUJ92_16375 [Armatimonadetes bacterium CG2_30_59_28]|nr:MAG: hypothetical protein AUJ92_16375 [Armatimonadetes bacterium CG2_30_59_28]